MCKCHLAQNACCKGNIVPIGEDGLTSFTQPLVPQGSHTVEITIVPSDKRTKA